MSWIVNTIFSPHHISTILTPHCNASIDYAKQWQLRRAEFEKSQHEQAIREREAQERETQEQKLKLYNRAVVEFTRCIRHYIRNDIQDRGKCSYMYNDYRDHRHLFSKKWDMPLSDAVNILNHELKESGFQTLDVMQEYNYKDPKLPYYRTNYHNHDHYHYDSCIAFPLIPAIGSNDTPTDTSTTSTVTDTSTTSIDKS